MLLFIAFSVEKGEKGPPPAHGIGYALHVAGKPSTASPNSLLPKPLRAAELVASSQTSTRKHNAHVWLLVHIRSHAQTCMLEKEKTGTKSNTVLLLHKLTITTTTYCCELVI